MNEKINIKKLRNEFSKKCTREGIMQTEFGFFGRYLYQIECITMIFTLLIVVVGIIIGLEWKFSNELLWAYIGFSGKYQLCFMIMFVIGYIIIVFLVHGIACYLFERLIKKNDKEYDFKKYRKYLLTSTNGKFNSFIQKYMPIKIPDINKYINERVCQNEEEYFKNKIKELSKSELEMIYKINENHLKLKSDKIYNASKSNSVAFLTIAITVIVNYLVQLYSTKEINTFSDITLYFNYIILVLLFGYLLFKFACYIYYKIEDFIFLSDMKREKNQILLFSCYLEKNILNYKEYRQSKVVSKIIEMIHNIE